MSSPAVPPFSSIEPLSLDEVAHAELEHEPYEEGGPDDLWCSNCEQM